MDDARTANEGGPFEAATQPDAGAADEASTAACSTRYTQCTLEMLAALRQDLCVRDAVRCGAISREEGARVLCSAQLTSCLKGSGTPLEECQRRFDQCSLDPWSDAGL